MCLAPATDADLEAVAALVNSAYRGEISRLGWTTEADFLDGQRTDVESLRKELASVPGSALLVLRKADDQPPVACVWMEPAEDHAWYLGMLTVRPDLQNRQIGREILDAAESYARSQGAVRMRMQVVHIRDTLIAWYERRGYRLTGETSPFPRDTRFGVPRRNDLAFVVLEKLL
jgi:ribosomal protein S18 acetylase RimI-like enzyme